jgi:hypothetical protein
MIIVVIIKFCAVESLFLQNIRQIDYLQIEQ